MNIGTKTENGGATAAGRLSADEFNELVGQVETNAYDITTIQKKDTEQDTRLTALEDTPALYVDMDFGRFFATGASALTSAEKKEFYDALYTNGVLKHRQVYMRCTFSATGSYTDNGWHPIEYRGQDNGYYEVFASSRPGEYELVIGLLATGPTSANHKLVREQRLRDSTADSLSSSSTDDTVPTSKAVYTAIQASVDKGLEDNISVLTDRIDELGTGLDSAVADITALETGKMDTSAVVQSLGTGSDTVPSVGLVTAELGKDRERLTALEEKAGGGFYNLTNEQPLDSGYYTLATAVAAMEDAGIDDSEKSGLIITFEESEGKWKEYRFTGTDTSGFTDPGKWEEYGGGKVKAVTLNGTEVTPDADGTVNLKIDEINVDESLDADSTNPVQNAAVTARLNTLENATIGSVEVIEDDDKNTLEIRNTKGELITSTEFSGGGGGGTSTASRIVISASLDKAQVKEGGDVTLTYAYSHVNAEGAEDGIKADITVTVKRGTTERYSATTKNVGAGTYTLDISDYLLAGTVDVFVKAVATTAEGTVQTKQAYASVSVVTLSLTSSYSLTTSVVNGGYGSGDTIEIPFAVTGSGTKDVSMYVDGAETPVSQTINKSGTVNGSFTLQASALAAGRHNAQLVAERDGLTSDSIYIDFLVAGSDTPFVGIKYTDKTGAILTGDSHLTPVMHVEQYGQLKFNYAAYDPESTSASVGIYLGGTLTGTVSAPRSMQDYTNRFLTQGTQEIGLKVGTESRTVSVVVEESSVSISERTTNLIAKFDASGRSNSESNPAQWTSGDIETTFEGFDWSSNGWTGDSLKLTNGAKAVIGYQPFKTDAKATGLTFEITMKVSNINTRSAAVVSCVESLEGGKRKGLLITAEEASFLTGETVDYTNEDGENVSRENKLGTNYVDGEWIKIAFMVDTAANNRLMHLYVNGNRTGADIYGVSYSFKQDNPQYITIDSSEADVEVRNIRIYNCAISDDEELENRMVDEESAETMLALYEDNNILGENDGVDIDTLLAKGKGVMKIVRANKLDDVYEANNKKTDFTADIYFYSPFGEAYDFVLKGCYIRIQGTSSTKYPSKNIRIYCAKGPTTPVMTIGGEEVTDGSNKYAMREGAVPMNLLCCKTDYSDSSMSLNTGGAKLFNDIFKELGLFTPPQRHQYEQGGSKTSAISVRTAIDGIPIDMFCAVTEDGESEYYGQYNLNNEKSKSQTLFGQEGVDGYTPALPMTFETLNNTEKMCLFQSDSDEEIPTIFDAGLETNFPDDVGWAGLTTEQQAAVTRLYSWIRACVPSGATSDDLSTFKSDKFAGEIDQYFDKDFILTYYLWTDYFLSVDQRAKNMLLRTWDGKVWYTTYYDGDTQLGKRNDCFLVYGYTTDRDTYDAEASKYAFEGRDSWLWNLVLANLQDDLKTCAAKLRAVMTNERVLAMFNTEQSGNWSDRAFNKSGEIKYIKPAVEKGSPFIYALQGSNTSHREYLIKNRFALLDAKYGTSNFTSDNIDMYLSRAASDTADVISITANEVYAFGYGTNNRQNIANTGIVQGGDTAELSVTDAYTVNDPIRLYGASRIGALDMTGAADHLKNAFDLSKCSVLRELNLESSGTGSTGWWLSLGSCASLRKLNLRNQGQAKTGGSSSTELDLSGQTKLEYLDARGCSQVRSVIFADGAPVETAYLPGTLTTLRLRYLSKLTDSGLSIEDYTNITTVIMAGCPGIDLQNLLDKCVSLKRLRVEGLDMEGDGSLLGSLMKTGGVDADGNFTDTCALVGTYRLTGFLDDDIFDSYAAHFPELDIRVPEYTMVEFDDTKEDPQNITNLENGTTGDDYQPSGHISKILSAFVPLTGQLNTETGKWEGKRMSGNNYQQLADGTSFDYKDSNVEGNDAMMRIPHLWYKGINDYKNQKKYIAWSSLTREPLSTATKVTRKTLLDTLWKENKCLIMSAITEGDSTLLTSGVMTDTSSYNTYRMDVSGMKQVRWPGVNSSNIGACFLDSEGVIISKFSMSVGSSDFAVGEYIFTDVPEGAVEFVFTTPTGVALTAEAIAVDSPDIEAIEPDWVESDPCLCGIYEASVDSLNKLRSLSNVQVRVGTGTSTTSLDWTYDTDGNPTATPTSALSYTCKDFQNLARLRGDGYQLIDYEMSKLVALLFFSMSGTRDGQYYCGYGRGSGGTTGYLDSIGNSTSIQYKATSGQGNKVLGLEGFMACTVEWMDMVAVNVPTYAQAYKDQMPPNPTTYPIDAVWHIYDPIRKTERTVQGLTTGWGYNVERMRHGRYCDIIASKFTADNSKWVTHYTDGQYYSASRCRVVYRSTFSADANGGLVFANASNASSSSNARYGSRLAFRGEIKIAE